MNRKIRKLGLKRETVRQLSNREVPLVVGGVPKSHGESFPIICCADTAAPVCLPTEDRPCV